MALDSPHTHPSRRRSRRHPTSRPLTNGLQAGQTDGESTMDAPCHRRVRRDTSSVKVLASETVARLPLVGFFWI